MRRALLWAAALALFAVELACFAVMFLPDRIVGFCERYGHPILDRLDFERRRGRP